jgi:hypothetical protein
MSSSWASTTSMPGGRYDRTRVLWNAYKGVLPVLIETRRKGDWVTHVDADEVSRAQYSGYAGVTSGTQRFDLQHHDFTVLQPLVS